MANILTIRPDGARGLRRLFFGWVRKQYGGIVPGVFQVLAVDLEDARPAGTLYNHLHLGKSASLSHLQCEMLATVVAAPHGHARTLTTVTRPGRTSTSPISRVRPAPPSATTHTS